MRMPPTLSSVRSANALHSQADSTSEVPVARSSAELKSAGGFGGRPDPRGFLTPGMNAWTVNPNEPLPTDPQMAQLAALQRAMEIDSKYFAFSDEKTGVHGFSGFHTLAPRTPNGVMIAYVRLFDPKRQIWNTCTNTIPLKDIESAFKQGKKRLELPNGQGGIEILGPDRIRWSFECKEFGFNFVAKAHQLNTLQLKSTLDPINGDLLGIPALKGVKIPPSEYTWSPEMLNGNVEHGQVRVGDKNFPLDGASVYHEESKGGWFPGEKSHGYHFFNMQGKDTQGHRVTLELGNFHSTPQGKELSSLTIIRNGRSHTYGADDMKITFDDDVQAAAHKDPWAEKMGVYVSAVPKDKMNEPGPESLPPHSVPTHFRIQTHDGIVVEGQVDGFQSITATAAGSNGNIPGNWSIDEGHATAQVSWPDGSAVRVRGETEFIHADAVSSLSSLGAPRDELER